jgi:putative ABC transport system permease protein
MLMQTIRHTFRSWWRTPVLAVTALLTLSLGVGFNAAIFSVVHAVLLRPLPYPAPERLVELFELDSTARGFRVSVLNYQSWASRSSGLEALAAFNGMAFNVTSDAEAERVAGAVVTVSLFRVLALEPLTGRALVAEDERPGSRRVALIARSFWQRRYGGDPSAIGSSIVLNGERHEIVGVVPEAFRDIGRSQISAVARPQIFVPVIIDPTRENRGNRIMRVVGRLRPRVSIEQAREELSAITAAMEAEFPSSNRGWGARIDYVHDSMLEEGVRPSLLMLLGAAAVVMLIACANVSNLVLAKAIGRQRELALRTALGAGPGQLARQLLTESVCLAVISGLIGVWVSFVAVEGLRSLLPPTMPRIDEVRVDQVVLGFGLLVSLLSGILFGILPAIRVSRVDPVDALTRGGRGLAAGFSHSRLRQGMVTAQLALATTLLVGAVLLLQSFVRLQRVPLGFDPDGVLTARIGLPRTAYPDASPVSGFYGELLESIGANPDVQAAAVATSAPFASGVRRGVPVANRATAVSISAAEHIVSDNYFRTLAIPILAGRPFNDRDRAGSPLAVIVSQATARQLWPGATPIGQQLEIDRRLHEVVGVAGDVRGDDVRGTTGGGLERQPPPAIYLSASQFPQNTMTVLLRTTREPSATAGALREAIREIDPALPADQVRALSVWLTEAAAQPRLTTTLAGAFAGMALLLAAMGIYGVGAYAVGQRRAEIGLRIALGATRRQVLVPILRGGLTSAVAGVLIGCAGAFFVNKVLAGLLFEVRPEDPSAFVWVAALLAAVALSACYVPARRAARIDPLVALRHE